MCHIIGPILFFIRKSNRFFLSSKSIQTSYRKIKSKEIFKEKSNRDNIRGKTYPSRPVRLKKLLGWFWPQKTDFVLLDWFLCSIKRHIKSWCKTIFYCSSTREIILKVSLLKQGEVWITLLGWIMWGQKLSNRIGREGEILQARAVTF